MKTRHKILFTVAALMLLGAIAAIYAYQKLPSILQQQAQLLLAEYGVQDVAVGKVIVSPGSIGTDLLELRGSYSGHRFSIRILKPELLYNWRRALGGKLESLTARSVIVELQELETLPATPDYAPVYMDKLLPYKQLSSLPTGSLGVPDWQVSYSQLAGDAVRASGSFLWDGNMTLKGEVDAAGSNLLVSIEANHSNPLLTDLLWSHATGDILSVQSQLSPAADNEWRWTIDAHANYAHALAWARSTGSQSFGSALSDIEISGSTALSASVMHANSLNNMPADAAALLALLTAEIKTRNSIESLKYPRIIPQSMATADAKVRLSSSGLELSLTNVSGSGRLAQDVLWLPPETQKKLRLKDTVPFRWDIAELSGIRPSDRHNWELSVSSGTAVVGNKHSEIHLKAVSIEAVIDASDLLSSSVDLASVLDIRMRKSQLPQIILKLEVGNSDTTETFAVIAHDTAESMQMELQGLLDLNTGAGSYKLQLDSLDLAYAASSVVPLLESFTPLKQALEISSGDVSLTTIVTTQSYSAKELQQVSALQLQSIDGSYGEYQFEGLQVKASLEGVDSWKTTEAIMLDLDRLNLGFDLLETKVQLDVALLKTDAEPVVTLKSFSTGVFGGRVFLPEARQWDFGAPSNDILMQADNWQLSEMVALQHGQNIEAIGLMEGELPVTVAQGRIIIKEGFLRAKPPGGTIKYRPDEASLALAESSSELKMALDLLGNFEYKALGSTVELDPQGNLTLGLSLAGKNPAFYGGRSVKFNINVEQNLDPLLQSLRLSDRLVEQLEQRIN